jgi:hypothetical protein
MDQVQEIDLNSSIKDEGMVERCVVEFETVHDKVHALKYEVKSCFAIPPEVLIMKSV